MPFEEVAGQIPRATTSRAASSAAGSTSRRKRRPVSSTMTAPFAPQGLGEERHRIGAHGQGRGVELDELEVREARAGARRHGQAVAGGLRGLVVCE